jgi:hypothetical protein
LISIFRGRFDHELHIAQFHGARWSHNPGATFLRLFLAHQAALDRVGVVFSMFARPRSICSSRATSRRITVTPRELSHCAMPEPITPAPITAACTIFSAGVFDVPFVFLREEKIANQVLRRLRLAELDNPSSSIRNDSSGEIDKVLLMIS